MKLEVFKNIESIDDETALLLYDNGFTTIDSIAIASIKDLTKIKGTKRKTAKKIKIEIEQKTEREPLEPELEKAEGKKEEKLVEKKVLSDKELTEWEPVDVEEFDIGEKEDESLEIEPIPIGETAEGEVTEEQIEVEDEWESFDEHKISELKMKEIKGFRYGDYTLYEKKLDTKSGKKRIVRFFSKAEPEEGNPIELPKGFEVKENKKTGLPYLKKKK
jgi:transcription termination factor NusA